MNILSGDSSSKNADSGTLSSYAENAITVTVSCNQFVSWFVACGYNWEDSFAPPVWSVFMLDLESNISVYLHPLQLRFQFSHCRFWISNSNFTNVRNSNLFINLNIHRDIFKNHQNLIKKTRIKLYAILAPKVMNFKNNRASNKFKWFQYKKKAFDQNFLNLNDYCKFHIKIIRMKWQLCFF